MINSKTKRDLPWLSRRLVGILYGSHYTTEGIKRDTQLRMCNFSLQR